MPVGQALLVVGHPGHELRVHGWLGRAKPIVMVLTDGSGHTGKSRTPSTAKLIKRAGAKPGTVFGRFSDAALYRALLDRNEALFTSLTEELADAIERHRITVVAGDDAEGYNPTHDVCRLIVDAAVELARCSTSRPIANLAFALMTKPDAIAGGAPCEISRIELDDAELERKLAAARHYPEMADEVRSARAAWGDRAFQIETFRHATPGELWRPNGEAPFYERHGSNRVAAGLYSEVIRHDQHIRPVAELLAARTRLHAQ